MLDTCPSASVAASIWPFTFSAVRRARPYICFIATNGVRRGSFTELNTLEEVAGFGEAVASLRQLVIHEQREAKVQVFLLSPLWVSTRSQFSPVFVCGCA